MVAPDARRNPRAEEASAAGREIAQLLAEAGPQPFDIGPGLRAGRAEESVAAIRADRDSEEGL